MKSCFKCFELKPLTDFYKHAQMADGRLNKCKECTKSDVKKHRKENIDEIRAYDRLRGSRQGYAYTAEYRAKYPIKYAAHTAVNNAVRAGILIPSDCEKCGRKEDVHAHHDDYRRQLDIRWLCPPCHKKWHIENGEGANGS